MRRVLEHAWDVSPGEAREIQRRLAGRVETADRLPAAVRAVAGVDVGFEDGGRVTRAAVAVLAFPQLTLVDRALARRPTGFPYVPGLLSFRELPAVLEAIEGLRILPDVWLCDGQGLAHPRRFGIACHLGVLLDAPSIGVGKTRLLGRHGPVPEEKGGWAPLLAPRPDGAEGEEVVGAVLRSRAGVRPVFVSPGHRVCLDTALRLVMACVTRYRLPETTRQAHRLASGPP